MRIFSFIIFFDEGFFYFFSVSSTNGIAIELVPHVEPFSMWRLIRYQQ